MTEASTAPEDEPWRSEIVAATRAEKAGGSPIAADLQSVAEISEVLAGTLARSILGNTPELSNANVMVVPARARGATSAHLEQPRRSTLPPLSS